MHTGNFKLMAINGKLRATAGNNIVCMIQGLTPEDSLSNPGTNR